MDASQYVESFPSQVDFIIAGRLKSLSLGTTCGLPFLPWEPYLVSEIPAPGTVCPVEASLLEYSLAARNMVLAMLHKAGASDLPKARQVVAKNIDAILEVDATFKLEEKILNECGAAIDVKFGHCVLDISYCREPCIVVSSACGIGCHESE